MYICAPINFLYLVQEPFYHSVSHHPSNPTTFAPIPTMIAQENLSSHIKKETYITLGRFNLQYNLLRII